MYVLIVVSETLKSFGVWMFNNLSVEGIISLPALMVGFLVAIAIYNFEDSRSGLKIDAPTVISQVVGVDKVLIAIFLVSLSPILWPQKEDSIMIYILPLLGEVYLFGLLLLVQSLQRAFNWAKSIETGNQDNFRVYMRIRYLESLSDKEKRSAWEKIWQADNDIRKLIDERQLIRLFVASVKNIKDKNSFAPWLVQDLISAVDTIHTDDPVIMQELVDFCMSDAFGIRGKEDINKRKEAGELHYAMNLRRLFFKVLEKSLEKDDNSLYSLISSARTYLKDNDQKEAPFIGVFAPNFFSLVEKHENNHWIWEIIPNDWKITLEKLLAKDTAKTTFAWLNAYVKWLHDHTLITNKPAEFNRILDETTREILPKADPITWARLFAFHWSSYGMNNGEESEYAQVRNFIENHLTFGAVSHVLTFYLGDDLKTKVAMKNEVDEVLEIATRTTVLPWFHDDGVMKKYLRAINDLKFVYKEDKEKLGKLEWLETTLKDIRKRIRQKSKKGIN